MTHDELASKIKLMKSRILAQQAKAQTKNEEDFADLLVSGLDVLGELFLDIKRIADKT